MLKVTAKLHFSSPPSPSLLERAKGREGRETEDEDTDEAFSKLVGWMLW
jgi:hypothetical protein